MKTRQTTFYEFKGFKEIAKQLDKTLEEWIEKYG